MSSSGFNPKTDNLQYGGVSALASVYNPIAEEIRDPDNYRYTFAGGLYSYIPYLDRGDATFKFFERMGRLSPTHGSCIKNIRTFAFGGGLVVNRKSDGFSDFEKTVVSDAEKTIFRDWVKSWTDTNNLLLTAEKIYGSFKTWGGSWLECIVTTVAGQKYITYKNHDYDRGRFYADPDSENLTKYVLISPSFSPLFLSKNPPQIVPVYPAFTNEVNGVKRTIIHLKNETVGRTWYGEPDSVMALYFEYLEYQLGRYTVEGYNLDWVAKVFFETFGDAEDTVAKAMFDEAIMQCFTNQGTRKKSVMHKRSQVDAEPTKVHEFSANTNEKFHESMSNIAAEQIYKAHDWHPMFSQKTAGSMGNSQEFREVFKMKYYTVIKPVQDKIFTAINTVLAIAEKELGYDNAAGLALGCDSLFMNLLLDETAVTNTAAAQP